MKNNIIIVENEINASAKICENLNIGTILHTIENNCLYISGTEKSAIPDDTIVSRLIGSNGNVDDNPNLDSDSIFTASTPSSVSKGGANLYSTSNP